MKINIEGHLNFESVPLCGLFAVSRLPLAGYGFRPKVTFNPPPTSTTLTRLGTIISWQISGEEEGN